MVSINLGSTSCFVLSVSHSTLQLLQLPSLSNKDNYSVFHKNVCENEVGLRFLKERRNTRHSPYCPQAYTTTRVPSNPPHPKSNCSPPPPADGPPHLHSDPWLGGPDLLFHSKPGACVTQDWPSHPPAPSLLQQSNLQALSTLPSTEI